MKKVFVSGRITAPTAYQVGENVRHARREAIKLMRKGYAVYCPHLSSENMGGALHRDPEEDFERWMAQDLEWLAVSDMVYMLKGFRQSRGAKRELAKAKELGLEIMYEDDKK